MAILSRFPIKQVDHRKYENRREAERRGMIRVEIQIAGRTINFVTTHLDYQYADGRLFETEQMLKFLEDVKGPLIVVGDFNDEPAGASLQVNADEISGLPGLMANAKGHGIELSGRQALKDELITSSLADRIV